MDEFVSHASFCSPPSSPSFFSTSGHSSVLELISCGVPEQWLVGGDVMDEDDDDIKPPKDDAEWTAAVLLVGSHSAAPGGSDQPPVTEQAVRKRGRKPSAQPGPSVSHVEAERQRRQKLNRRFCELGAAVPTVSRMDKASLLADAAAYIGELRGRVERLEAEAKQAAAARRAAVTGGPRGWRSKVVY